MADNVDFIRSLYDAWNRRDLDAWADATAPGGTVTVAGAGDVFKGPEGARQYAGSWAAGFPDGEITVDNIVADGDRVVVEITGRGTHTGTLETSMGPIAPTGRSATIKLCNVHELVDGKLMTQRSYFDSGSIMAQLGLLGEQTATTSE
jgi:predicted ester cyclase